MPQNPAPQPGAMPQPGAAPMPQPGAAPKPGLPPMRRFARFFLDRLDRVSLVSKLVASTLIVLIIGTAGISYSIRQLVGNYLVDKIDSQLTNQNAQFIYTGAELMKSSDVLSNMPNNYFMQVRDAHNADPETWLLPTTLPDGLVSVPRLPASGSTNVTFGEPFTTSAIVTVAPHQGIGRGDIKAASSPWRVIALKVQDDKGRMQNICYIGLSMGDTYDTINTLTRYCVTVGIAIVLIGGSLSALIFQRTLVPLKRIEKTAAKIAAGDLSQRIPSAPENTEVGSLAASLNTMLARIESSFREQEETTEKMKRFVSDASHELRTPLAAIHGYAELYTMQRGMPGALERADESIAHIERSSQRMTVLVEDLLSLARLDEGRGIDMTQRVPVTTLVEDAADDLHALDPEREITRGAVALVRRPAPAGGADSAGGCDLAVTPGPMPDLALTGDVSRLRQVVTNIVGNIHRYTPADSPAQMGVGVVTASIAPAALAALPATDESMRRFLDAAEVGGSMGVGTDYAVLRFVDHGPGVPAESRPRLFERFYTADPSRAREKGGTGLGLAIAQSVAKAHKGFICATATDGGGLTFTIVLPIGPAAPAPSPTDGTAGEGQGGKGRAKAKGREGAKDKERKGSWFGGK
ncbi:HAMP domain-containing protein [Bifidobacterium pullorum subsp. saeculare]|uniref:histidine kinase n=2 Tax=Bifidobacterium pullorum TaxID=78448 RepID=A0A938WX25_9BIFI|nr:HAMP domain-containing protein [Bifidobacterium pullorum subsp. saeculare]